MTVKARAAYIKNPFRCPYCRSPEIQSAGTEQTNTYVRTKNECTACRRVWVEVFTITDVEEVDALAETADA